MFMWWLFTLLFASFRWCFFGLVSISSRLWGSIRLCPFVFLPGLVLLPCGISGKMTIPSKSLLSFLASCSLYCYAAIPTTCFIMPPILPCQASNPPSLANRCLAMLLLCSTALIALLVVGVDEVCPMLEHGYYWDIIIISYLLQRIYILGKGWKARPYAWCFVPLLPP